MNSLLYILMDMWQDFFILARLKNNMKFELQLILIDIGVGLRFIIL